MNSVTMKFLLLFNLKQFIKLCILNGSTITVGNADDTDTLTLGIIREKDSRLLKGAIYYFALYNKSLTPEEIETEKERLNEEWLKRKTE